MAEEGVHVVARVKKVGNSLALFIPAADARRAGIQEGQLVDAQLQPKRPEILGILKHLPYARYSRRDLYDE